MKLFFILSAFLSISASGAVNKSMYVAVLKPVNQEAIGPVSGAVTINIENDTMITNMRFSSSLPSTLHGQSIHIGNFCPTSIADENLDGYVDFLEASAYTSEIIIPLDGDLNSQQAGAGLYPLSDNWGSYIYSKINSYKSLLDDLYADDLNLDDNIVKLKKPIPMDFEQKVVLIYGVPDDLPLPETVRTSPELTKNQSIPLACGIFSKVETIPGQVENDDITIRTIGWPGLPGNDGSTQPQAPNGTVDRNKPPRCAGKGCRL